MFKQKRGDIAFIILIFVLISLGAVITIININVDFNEDNKSQWGKTKTEDSFDNIEDNSESKSENNQNSIISSSSTDSSTSGGGGSGGNSVTESLTCTTRLARYSLTAISSIQTCNEFDGEICLNKTIFCSTNIVNDDIVKVIFNMELLFVQSGTNKEDNLKNKTAKYLINPSKSVFMADTLHLNSQGEDGVANQKINCFFNTIKDIEAEICI